MPGVKKRKYPNPKANSNQRATIIQPNVFIWPDNWPVRATTKPMVSQIKRERMILLSVLESAFLVNQQIRPIPIKHAPQNLTMSTPAESRVTP